MISSTRLCQDWSTRWWDDLLSRFNTCLKLVDRYIYFFFSTVKLLVLYIRLRSMLLLFIFKS